MTERKPCLPECRPAFGARGEEQDWPKDFPHENGNYQNKCCECGELFMGHKRRVVCRTCANKPAPAEAPKAEEPRCLPDCERNCWSGQDKHAYGCPVAALFYLDLREPAPAPVEKACLDGCRWNCDPQGRNFFFHAPDCPNNPDACEDPLCDLVRDHATPHRLRKPTPAEAGKSKTSGYIAPVSVPGSADQVWDKRAPAPVENTATFLAIGDPDSPRAPVDVSPGSAWQREAEENGRRSASSAPAENAGEPSMTKVFADSFEAVCAERDSLRAENEKLRQERDADRRREYGYSQETVDAISQERDALRDAVASLNIDAERGAKAETALCAEVERLKREVEDFLGQRNEAVYQLGKARAELSAAKEEIAKLRAILTAADDMEAKFSRESQLEQQLAAEKAAREKAEEELSISKEEIADCHSDYIGLASDLQTRCDQLSAEKAARSKAEARVKVLEDGLKELTDVIRRDKVMEGPEYKSLGIATIRLLARKGEKS